MPRRKRLSGKDKNIRIVKSMYQMNKTKARETEKQIAVDIEKLAAMLSCGHATARKIGEDAGARINIGRRVLYSVEKVERYIFDLTIRNQTFMFPSQCIYVMIYP